MLLVFGLTHVAPLAAEVFKEADTQRLLFCLKHMHVCMSMISFEHLKQQQQRQQRQEEGEEQTTRITRGIATATTTTTTTTTTTNNQQSTINITKREDCQENDKSSFFDFFHVGFGDLSEHTGFRMPQRLRHPQTLVIIRHSGNGSNFVTGRFVPNDFLT